MCGAVVRRWVAGSNAGRNAGNTGENTGGNARNASEERQQQRQGALVVTPGRAARSAASAASGLRCLVAGLASVETARCAGGLYSPERPPSDAGALHGPSSHASTQPASLACSTAPRAAPRVRPCSPARLCIRLDPSWLCQKSPKKTNYAYCPTAPGLGTLGGMSHATPAARQRTHRAPTLPTGKGRARTCPNLPSGAQCCPARTVALPVLGKMRDNLSRAVRHDGCPRYAGRLDVDSTRSAAFPLRPPDALGAPLGFQLRGSSRLTAWRRTSWRQARSVGHSAAGSLSPMQGQHETQHHQQQTVTRAAASLLEGDRP
jgi:hypothetical protein